MDHLLEKATRQHTRDHNHRLLLRTIYEYGEISRADLARLTQLTRTTVSEVVGELMRQDLVEAVGHKAIALGRTPTLLSVADDARLMLAISVTNEEISAALLNLRGSARHEARIALPQRDGEAVLATLIALADQLLQQADRPLLGIGITLPGLIDTANGVVLRAVSFGWEDLALREILQARFHLPVYLANDSQSLALARYMFGEHESSPNLALIKVGRGIGAGIILGGHLFAGEGYGAGEIGHLVVEANGPACKCGNRGCLETMASSAAILERAAELCAAHPESLLAREPLSLAAIGQAISAGDALAQQLLSEAGRYLGIAAASIVSLLNLRQIVITGRIAALGQPLAEAIHAELASRALPRLARDTVVQVADLGPTAPLLGAITPLLTYELGLARLKSRPELGN